METTAEAAEPRSEETVRRFSVNQRLQHLVVMVTFTVLALTGVPQRFSDFGASQWMIENLGGIHAVRLIHRTSGIVFVIAALYHLGFLFRHIILQGRPMTMMVTVRDFLEAIQALRYDLGLSQRHPKFGRFDFRQKFEYWGMLFGGAVISLSGLILMYPTWATKFLPGQLIPVAKTAHGYEGLMALAVIVIWHLYGAHFGPDRFPADTAIFTGKITRERMRKEHSLEYQELLDAETEAAASSETDP